MPGDHTSRTLSILSKQVLAGLVLLLSTAIALAARHIELRFAAAGLQPIVNASNSQNSGDDAELVKISPDSGQQGQYSLAIVITGRSTHFIQGKTRVDFGEQIHVRSVQVGSAISVTAIIDIDPDAHTGPRDITVSTDTDRNDRKNSGGDHNDKSSCETAALKAGFIVTQQVLPTITSVYPNSGQQGQQKLSVEINGKNTHFEREKTRADFGVGIHVVALNVASATDLVVVIDIDPNAPIGPHDVTVSSNSDGSDKTKSNENRDGEHDKHPSCETVVLKSGFNVTGQVLPTLLSVNPTSGQQGQQSLAVAITGQNTHFTQSSTTVSFGAGITVASLTVSSPTSATATINIDPGAATGTRMVTVTSNTETVSLANGFAVTPGTPVVTGVNPAMGQQGQQNLSVVITGLYTHFAQGETTASLGAGITVVSLTVLSATSAIAIINIDSAAATGARNVTVTSESEVASLANAFNVTAGTPVLTLFSPNTGQQGQQNLSVAITGQYTHFVQGMTSANFGSGITTVSLTVSSPTTASAVVNIDPSAATGIRNVTVTTNSEVETLPNTFTVTAGTPVLTLLNPSSGQQGQQGLSVAVTGQFTHFAQGMTTASFGAGITVVSLTVNSATSATATISIDPAAAVGTRTFSLTSGSETASLINGFAVNPGTPTLVSLNPATGQQGQQNLAITINGQFTHFAQAVTTANFGAGITVTSLTVSSAMSVIAVINIDPTAATGTRSVAITSSAETVSLPNAFTVSAATATLTSVSPAVGQQGQHNLAVTITGQFTTFVQGTTLASFGPGISVGGAASGSFGPATVTSPTSAGAVLSIDGSAALGSRAVTVSTGLQSVSLSSGFSVGQGIDQAPVVSAGTDQTITEGWELLVSSLAASSNQIGDEAVLRFDGQSGTFLGVVTPIANGIQTPDGLYVDTANRLYVTVVGNESDQPGGIYRYDLSTGTFIDVFVPRNDSPGFWFGPDGYLYTSNGDQQNLLTRYNAVSGQPIGPFAPLPATGESFAGANFGPDGNFYAAEVVSNSCSILRFDGKTGAFLGIFATCPQIPSFFPAYLLFGPDGQLYLSGDNAGNVIRFDGKTGAYIDTFVAPHSGGLVRDSWMAFGPDGNLYVGDVSNSGQVLRYDGTSGAFIDKFIPPSTGGLLRAWGMIFHRVGSPAVLSGMVTDDGLPLGATVTSTWTKVSGPGVVTFGSPSSPNTTADFSMPGTYLLRLTATDTQLSSSSDVTIVVNPAQATPTTISSIAPQSGQQGQSNLQVTISGQNTKWTQGTTTVNFGSGITVSSVVVNSATNITVTIAIDSTTNTGERTITVSTGSESEVAQNGFTITSAQAPLVNAGPNQTVTSGWDLLAVNYGSSAPPNSAARLLRFDAATGAFIGIVASQGEADLNNATYLSLGPDLNAYLGNAPTPTGDQDDDILRFDSDTGAFINQVVPQGSGGTFTFGPDGTLYTANAYTDRLVKHFDPKTGAFLGAFSAALDFPRGMVFGPDGNLYVGNNSTVTKIDGQSGAILGSFISPGAGGLNQAGDIIFGPDGNLYVADFIGFNILRYDGKTGAFKDVFVPSGSGGMQRPYPIAFGPDGNFYVGTDPLDNTGGIYRYDGKTGAFIDNVVPNGSGGVTDVSGFAFRPRTPSDLTVTLNAAASSSLPLSLQWSEVSGPGTASFTNSTALQTTVAFDALGTYVLRLTASNSAGSSSSDVSVTLLQSGDSPPIVDAGPGENGTIQTPVGLAGSVGDDGLPSPKVLLVQWSVVSSPGNVTFANPHAGFTTATFDTPGAYDLRLTANDGLLQSSSNVTVTIVSANPPALVSLVPNNGKQGQQNLTVAINGQNTHFVQGMTSAFLGAGITVVSLTVNSLTTATAVLSILPTTSVGSQTVTITTGTEVASLPNGFTVTAGTPALIQILPNLGTLGQQNISVGIAGLYTHFSPGVTNVSFGNESSVNLNLGGFDQSRGGSYSLRDGSFLTGIRSAIGTAFPSSSISATSTLTSAYLSTVNALVISSATAHTSATTALSSDEQSALLKFVLGGGTALVFVDNDTFSSQSPSVNNSFLSPFGLHVTGTLLDLQTAGVINQTSPVITGPSGTASILTTYYPGWFDNIGASTPLALYNANGQPALSILPPSSLSPGSGAVIFFSDSNTLEDGISTADDTTIILNAISLFAPNLTVGAVNVTSPTTLTVQVSIGPNAQLGPMTVAATTGSEVASLQGGFSVISTPVPPSIGAVQPTMGQQGQSNLSVAITGINTRWAQGSTIANFGAGITVESLTVSSPSNATAVINIDAAAPVGSSSITMTTGAEVENLPNGFSVTASASGNPAILIVSPSSGPAGQGGPVGIQGLNTHFVQGVTSLDFGSGISVSNVVVGCSTCLTATLVIDPAASLGPRTVTITTGTEVVTLVAGFAVTSSGSTPILTSINPINSRQGQSLSVAITGLNTHFVQGTTQVSFGAGITTTAVSVSSSTSLVAQIKVDVGAAPGARAVSVTTGAEVESVAGVFNVAAGLPALYSLNPGSAQQGAQDIPVVVTGVFTHFVQGVSQVSFGAGITVTNVIVSSPTTLTAQISVAANAPLGGSTATVNTNGEVVNFPNGFTVTPPTPLLYTIDPGGARQGQQNLPVVLTGQYTNWQQGSTAVSFGAGITVVSVNVASPTSATAILDVDPAAPIGQRVVSVTTGNEVDTFPDGFQIVSAGPRLLSATPNTGQPGQLSLSVQLIGQNTDWAQGVSTVSFGSEITVNSLTVGSSTSATAVIAIDPSASTGARSISIMTGGETDSLPNGFTISSGAASLLSVNPNTAQAGQQSVAVAITGLNTHFAQGTTTASFGAGISIASLTVNSATTASAVINIDPATISGPRTVTLITGTEAASLPAAFTVTGPAPVLSSISPNTGQQGQQNLSITVTGQNTHFTQGLTQVSFGPDVSVNSVNVSSATTLTVLATVSISATTGPHTVTATTGTEQVSLQNGFSVQASSTALVVTPNSATQGKTLSVTISGTATSFVQGTTMARFGPGIMVGNGIAGDFGPVTVVNATTATAEITILNSALPGARTVSVQTGTEVTAAAGAFSVVGLPTLLSVSPSTALRGQSGPVVITGVFTNFSQGTTQASFGAGISVGGGPEGGFGSVTVTSPTSAIAQINVDSSATLGLRAVTVQTGAEQASLTTGFSVLGPVTGPSPEVAFTSPAEGAEVTTAVSVTGTVTSPNLDYWTLEYQSAGATTFTQFASGTTPTASGMLDPTLLLNGITTLRLTGVDTSGQTSSTTLDVVITRNQKVGNFTVSFNDLTVPVAGIPIQIVRTYDSRNKLAGDFGVGWTLDVKYVSVSTNGPLGSNWTGTTSGGFLPNYCVQPTQAQVVTVSFTDGTTYEFQPVLQGQCQQIIPPLEATMSFAPIGVTPPSASLTLAGSNAVYLYGSFPGSISLLNLDELTTFDPDQYILTLPDGRTLQISRQLGLQSMTDTNGNSLTITPSGIMHSSGKGIAFTRDSQGRITQIQDPSGNTLIYEYSDTGDLVSFTDQTNHTSSYTYNDSHGLLTIVDPDGAQPIRNDYDDDGRLVSHTDAFGQVINYTYDLDTQQEIVTDRLGNVTVNEYDADGNIVKITDAKGGVTTRTYDSRDNLLTETNALKQTRSYTYDSNNNRLTETDPPGNTTTYTYNSLNQVLTITDPLNHLTTNTYDGSGNLLSTQDAAGNTTTYVYNSQGLRTSMTDALGNSTTYQYDSFGNLTQETDPLGHVTSYTYDSNSNKLSETKTRTSGSDQITEVTSYQYDPQNRLVQTTYPDGSTTQVQYNAIGKQSTTTDQLGRQTGYQYDLMGRLTQTSYPDGNSETSSYDAEGDRISSTDRTGRVTTYVYDQLKRLTQTIYPDSASTTTGYDSIGEVVSVTDPLGNVTQSQYDAAGRRVQSTDALGHMTGFAYDNAGNQVSMTDANGNKTQYQYDQLSRRTAVTYPDKTSDATTYDALGRTASKTDQAGNVTQFGCDPLGRLLQVTDALGQITKYTYDEVGDRLTQTDANQHATTFDYDDLGRRTRRTLPLGMSETMTYDAAGNLIAKTDFNGKTTTYSYDEDNRLTMKSPDSSFGEPPVNFTYTATGERQSMTDASGTTSYTYDLRDRRLTKATPEGTLNYTYDLGGNLTSIRSSNAGGTSVTYTYDQLNRLATVVDNRQASQTTSYSYDNVGNLASYAYPNGVTTGFQYDTLNRLTNLTVAGSTALAGYSYTLGPSGNRTAVSELSGRQVHYTYDNLYRLTGETISGDTADPSGNGAIGYVYDPVGNRLSRTSTVAAVPTSNYAYDANDRLMSDSYDANGSTIASSSNTFTYDFENHLLSQSGNSAVGIVYDGDGNRVAETVGKTTIQYLVDDRSLTGYPQVLEELSGGVAQRVYTYGLNRISQSQASGTRFYGDDGHGNVRLLTDSGGAVTDRYDYDAFGNLINQSGNTPNMYLYSGEQNDANLSLYYLRARYLSPSIGRFWNADSVEGELAAPLSLHRYLYAQASPVNRLDPSGRLSFEELGATVSIYDILSDVLIPHFIFGGFTVAVEVNLLEPGFAAQNGALATIASTSDPIIIEHAINEYNMGSKLISFGTANIQALKQSTDFANDLVDLSRDTVDLYDAEDIPTEVLRGTVTGLAVQELTSSLNEVKESTQALDTALRTGTLTASNSSTDSSALTDGLNELFKLLVGISTSGDTFGSDSGIPSGILYQNP